MRRYLTRSIATLGLALAAATVALAQDGDVPGAADYPGLPRNEGAIITGYDAAGEGTYRLVIGPGGAAAPAKEIAGHRTRIAYREAEGVTIDSAVDHYQPVTADAGYEFVFSCESTACGGLDLIDALELLPAPQMEVDPDNYGYVVLRRTGTPNVLVTFLISESNGRTYTEINVIEVD